MTELTIFFKFTGQLAEWLLEHLKITIFIFYVINVLFWMYQDGLGIFSAMFFGLISTPISSILLIIPIFIAACISTIIKDHQSLNP